VTVGVFGGAIGEQALNNKHNNDINDDNTKSNRWSFNKQTPRFPWAGRNGRVSWNDNHQ
jgi:hypothetical protein